MEEKSLPVERDISLDALIIIFVKKKSERLNLIRKASLIMPLFFAVQLKCADQHALTIAFDHNRDLMEKPQCFYSFQTHPTE